MDTDLINENSGANTVGTQTGTPGSSSDEVNDALRQLQASVSDFVQEAQASTESLIAPVSQMSQQFRATDSQVQQTPR